MFDAGLPVMLGRLRAHLGMPAGVSFASIPNMAEEASPSSATVRFLVLLALVLPVLVAALSAAAVVAKAVALTTAAAAAAKADAAAVKAEAVEDTLLMMVLALLDDTY